MRALALALEVLLNCSSTETKYYLAVIGLLSASFSGIPPLIAYVIVLFIIMRDMRLERSHLAMLALSSVLLSFVKAPGLSTRKVWSISRTPRQISICSFQIEKLVPFNGVIPEI
jgi:hypothetical protein